MYTLGDETQYKHCKEMWKFTCARHILNQLAFTVYYKWLWRLMIDKWHHSHFTKNRVQKNVACMPALSLKAAGCSFEPIQMGSEVNLQALVMHINVNVQRFSSSIPRQVFDQSEWSFSLLFLRNGVFVTLVSAFDLKWVIRLTSCLIQYWYSIYTSFQRFFYHCINMQLKLKDYIFIRLDSQS